VPSRHESSTAAGLTLLTARKLRLAPKARPALEWRVGPPPGFPVSSTAVPTTMDARFTLGSYKLKMYFTEFPAK